MRIKESNYSLHHQNEFNNEDKENIYFTCSDSSKTKMIQLSPLKDLSTFTNSSLISQIV